MAEPARPRQTCVPLPPLARGRLVQLSKRLACRRATASRLRSDRGRRGGRVGYGFRRKATRGSTFQAGHHGRHTPTWVDGWVHWRTGRAPARAPPRPRGTGKAARPRTETGKPSGGRPNRIGIYRIASSRTVAFARIVELAQRWRWHGALRLPVASVSH